MTRILNPFGVPYPDSMLPRNMRGVEDRSPTRGQGSPQGERIEFPEIPQAILDDIGESPASQAPFVKAVSQALQYVFADPRTRPRTLSKTMVQDIIRKAFAAWTEMRSSMGYSRRKCYDILPRHLHAALLKGQDAAAHADEHGKGNMWSKDATDQDTEVTVPTAGKHSQPGYTDRDGNRVESPEDIEESVRQAEATLREM